MAGTLNNFAGTALLAQGKFAEAEDYLNARYESLASKAPECGSCVLR